MEVNGSLVFDTFAGSEIKKLRVEKVSANPSAIMSDVGRLIYNTATKQFLIGRDNGNSTYMWDLITTSTSSDIAAIQTEIDAIELAMGLKADGTFDPTKFTGTLAGKTSYVDLIATLQTLVATASTSADSKLPLAGGTVSGAINVDSYILSEGFLSRLDVNTVGVTPQWWKIGRLNAPNATSGKIVIGGTNGYTPVGGSASSGETVILLRAENDSKVRGQFYSTSAGASAVLGVVVDDSKDLYLYMGQGFRGAITVFGQMILTPAIAQVGAATPAGSVFYSKQAFMLGTSNPLTLLPTGASLVGNVTVDGGTLSVNGVVNCDVLSTRTAVNTGSVSQWWKLGRLVTVSTSTAATMTITSASGYITGGGAASGTTGGETTIYFRAEDDTKIRGSFFSITGGTPGVTAVIVDDNRDVFVKLGNYFTGNVFMQGQIGFTPGVVAMGATQPAGYVFKAGLYYMLDGTTQPAFSITPDAIETNKSLYIRSAATGGYQFATGLHLPNGGGITETGVDYRVMTLGVGGGANAYTGQFIWNTRSGLNGNSYRGYALGLKAYNGGTALTSPELFSINGDGDVKLSGVLSVNGTGTTTLGVSGTQAQGTQKLTIANCANFYVSSGNFVNSSAATLTLSSNNVTGRTINAGGTINASGADYAEYMHKASGCGVVAPGQIIGVDSHGLLTEKWDDAISFMIKSTDPCMVGGDKWAAHLGERPESVERILPSIQPMLVSEAVPKIDPVMKEIDGKLIVIKPGVPAQEAVYVDEHIPGDTDAEWNAKQAPLIAFDAELQRARQMVDRIAFCGQVPVNVYGASPGDYIIPSRDGMAITGIPISEDDITMKQYIRSIGRVIRIDEDGRAYVVVKVA